MYHLAPQVYPVTGAAGACLYDLAGGTLWHLSRETAALLLSVCSDAAAERPPEAAAVTEQLCAAGLLLPGSGEIPDIRSLSAPPKIEKAWIEVNTDCNLRCRHCYNAAAGSGIQMTPADFDLACARLREAGIARVQIIGGEPLRHPLIAVYLERAAAQFPHVLLFTNATLLTEPLVRQLRRLHITAAVSVYSYLPEMHDAVTGVPGSHTAAEAGIALLRQYGVPCRTAPVYMKGIARGERGSAPYFLDPARDIVRMAGRGNLHLLSPELLRRKLITKETFRHPLRPERVRAAVSGNPCFARKIYVAADLTVYPCVMERRMQHGSLRSGTLSEILKPDILAFGREQVRGCAVCEYRYACPACLPDSLSDDPSEPPYYCTYDPLRGVWRNAEQQIALLTE